MPHLNGNIMAAVDFETTGVKSGWHEPIQMAVVPLNSDLRPMDDVRPFYVNIKPEHPERQDPEAARVHQLDMDQLILYALDRGRVESLFIEWVESLKLPFERKLIPLAHNWPFEHGFFKAWLGHDLCNKIWHGHARDAMEYAASLNDKAYMRGAKVPFSNLGLGDLCKHFGVINPKAHDALHDCLAEAEVYRHLLNVDIL
jgi:DNA polymerase III epsilon subunit-like protein